MNIIPDLTLVAVQLVPFLVLMMGLHVILFKPMLAYLDECQAATAGARHRAEELQAKANERVAQWEQAIAKARSDIAELRSGRRAQANGEYQGIVAASRKAAEARVGEAAAVIRAEASAARSELQAQSRVLAGDVATKVLGRPLAGLEA